MLFQLADSLSSKTIPDGKAHANKPSQKKRRRGNPSDIGDGGNERTVEQDDVQTQVPSSEVMLHIAHLLCDSNLCLF